jgi:hypothetical protein
VQQLETALHCSASLLQHLLQLQLRRLS